jgi:hypothetical protein
MREKLKKLQIRLTELAGYLNISRPTLYKYVEMFDTRQKTQINPVVLKLFEFITQKKDITRKEVLRYIISGQFVKDATIEENELLNLIQTYIHKTYDENNYSNELGKIILLARDIKSKRLLTEEENNKIIKIIKGEN